MEGMLQTQIENLEKEAERMRQTLHAHDVERMHQKDQIEKYVEEMKGHLAVRSELVMCVWRSDVHDA